MEMKCSKQCWIQPLSETTKNCGKGVSEAIECLANYTNEITLVCMHFRESFLVLRSFFEDHDILRRPLFPIAFMPWKERIFQNLSVCQGQRAALAGAYFPVVAGVLTPDLWPRE